METLFSRIAARDPVTRLVHVVIDTPRGSRNKYKFDEELGCFKLSRILPAGHVFPYDFGSIPGTRGEDGDALDVLVLMDEPTFAGCLVAVRLIGVLAAYQLEKGRRINNDRLVGVPQTPVNAPALAKLSDLGAERVAQIEHFFTSYNAAQGRRFKVTGRLGPQRANAIVNKAISESDRTAEK